MSQLTHGFSPVCLKCGKVAVYQCRCGRRYCQDCAGKHPMDDPKIYTYGCAGFGMTKI